MRHGIPRRSLALRSRPCGDALPACLQFSGCGAAEPRRRPQRDLRLWPVCRRLHGGPVPGCALAHGGRRRYRCRRPLRLRRERLRRCHAGSWRGLHQPVESHERVHARCVAIVGSAGPGAVGGAGPQPGPDRSASTPSTGWRRIAFICSAGPTTVPCCRRSCARLLNSTSNSAFHRPTSSWSQIFLPATPS